jgi:uncharacterized protein
MNAAAVDENGYNAIDPHITTQYGTFYLNRPEFKPEAIAHGLAQQARYNGHASEQYSVAEHSLMVAGIMRIFTGFGDPFEGLMHDAAEAYTRDIPSPWKPIMPDSVAIEDKLDSQIRAHFNLPPHKTAGCHEADKIALFIEAWFLMPHKGEAYTDPLGVRPTAMELINGRGPDGKKWKVIAMDWKLGKHMWLEAFKHYGPQISVVEGLGGVEGEAARAANGNKAQGHALVIP